MIETVVKLASGIEVRCPAYPEPACYIRVVDPKRPEPEIGYWDEQEFAETPAEVMGALMGLLRSASSTRKDK